LQKPLQILLLPILTVQAVLSLSVSQQNTIYVFDHLCRFRPWERLD